MIAAEGGQGRPLKHLPIHTYLGLTILRIRMQTTIEAVPGQAKLAQDIE
jgi:hypothetical protein